MLPKLLRLALYLFATWAVLVLVMGWFKPQWQRELDRAMRIAATVLLLTAIGALGWHLSR